MSEQQRGTGEHIDHRTQGVCAIVMLTMGLAVLIMIGFIMMLFGPVCDGFLVVSVVVP